MKYNFRLQKVLDHRGTLLDLAKKDFSEAQNELRIAELELNEFQIRIQKAYQEQLSLVETGQCPGEKLRLIHDYIKGMELKMERQKMIIKERLVKVEEQQLILQQKALDCKILEKLKERKRDEFRNEVRKREEKDLSELANAKYKLRQDHE